VVRVIDLRDGSTITSHRPELKATIPDGGSGIDAFTATWNGQWLLMEYDPEQDLLRWERDEDLPSGAGALTMAVTDRAGNVSERRLELTIAD